MNAVGYINTEYVLLVLFLTFLILYITKSQDSTTQPTPPAEQKPFIQTTTINWGGWDLESSTISSSCTTISFASSTSLTSGLYVLNTNFTNSRNVYIDTAQFLPVNNDRGFDFGSSSMFGLADPEMSVSTVTSENVTSTQLTALSLSTNSAFALNFYVPFRGTNIQFCLRT